jgi:hypothetical protein
VSRKRLVGQLLPKQALHESDSSGEPSEPAATPKDGRVCDRTSDAYRAPGDRCCRCAPAFMLDTAAKALMATPMRFDCLLTTSTPVVVPCRLTSPTPSALRVSHSLSGLIPPTPCGLVSCHNRLQAFRSAELFPPGPAAEPYGSRCSLAAERPPVSDKLTQGPLPTAERCSGRASVTLTRVVHT